MGKDGPIRLDQTVREVIERHPVTLEVFARHGLDLCCGGIHPVRMAAQAHGLDPEALLAELEAAVRRVSR